MSAETREGELVGSGDGIVTGASLIGKASFSMYTGNCTYVFVRAGLVPLPGQHLCTVNPAGVIATDDGAQIWFDASSPHVGRHSWDGSAKMPDDSQLYCKPKHGYAVDKE